MKEVALEHNIPVYQPIKIRKDYEWAKDLNIDVVMECTGIFTAAEKAKVHLDCGAKRVLVSAPSAGADKTIVFGVNQVIPGWVEALQLMPVGSKWRLFIPSNLAYGEHGAGEMIEPNSTLIFDVELLDIVK